MTIMRSEIRRCVSELSADKETNVSNRPDSPAVVSTNQQREGPPLCTVIEEGRGRRFPLKRFVSQELPVDLDDICTDCTQKRRQSNSPLRCVSDIDKVRSSSSTPELFVGLGNEPKHDVPEPLSSPRAVAQLPDETSNRKQVPPLPNPLHDAHMLEMHATALQIEADIFPMRLILARLMANVSHNRRGLFNTPVDPVALGIPDYFSIIKRPMDLGTIKAKLHAIAYSNRENVANDIRLVFKNAIQYNPPNNPVRAAASSLLQLFETAYAELLSESNPSISSSPSVHWSDGVSAVRDSAAQHEGEGTSTRRGSESRRLLRIVSTTTFPEVATTEAPKAEVSQAQVVVTGKRMFEPAARSSLPPRNREGDPDKAARKRRRASRKRALPPHKCNTCLGRTCPLCNRGCLHHEPSLLICNGANCTGSRIRKGAIYYIAKDGSCHFCQRCYSNLSAVLPELNDHSQEKVVRYKRELLKRKNDEEIVEEWVTCVECGKGVHSVCAMFSKHARNGDDYRCPTCVSAERFIENSSPTHTTEVARASQSAYTFLSGEDMPVSYNADVSRPSNSKLAASDLNETSISAFLEMKVKEQMMSKDCPNAENTIVVRAISDCTKHFRVPDVVQKHFHMESNGMSPPSKVHYNSKAFGLFQKIDGFDVCMFCMYVQEYNGEVEFDSPGHELEQEKRVYIAYIDSVEHFRPRACRSRVYQEMLVAYLATARSRGYETAHIWACPPLRGNSFVFWNHPASQRTPTKERLEAWYHSALGRAASCGVVVDVKSLYEASFEKHLGESAIRTTDSLPFGKLVCPPLLDGDFWIEEAVRIHAASAARLLKSRPTPNNAVVDDSSSIPIDHDSSCPARILASLMEKRIMSHPRCAAFCRPVNAAALKLVDYHKIIAKPMDLGTIYSRLLLGEFVSLRDFVMDIELVFANAMRYNPQGHYVHNMAIEMRSFFFRELQALISQWVGANPSSGSEQGTWEAMAHLSLSLDERLPRSTDVSPTEVPGADQQQSCPASPVQSACEAPQLSPGQVPSTTEDPSLCSAPSTPEVPPSAATAIRSPLSGGPDGVQRRMVGKDLWLLEKSTVPSKSSKKSTSKRKSLASLGDEQSSKRRRQSWLGEEVGESVRKLRTSFFVCRLNPKQCMSTHEKEALSKFESYIESFSAEAGDEQDVVPSGIADSRHALLEFSQYRNLEFDTLRRAKYSSAILLYHLHTDAPGVIPECTTCKREITDVRWHRVKSSVETSQKGRGAPFRRKLKPLPPKPAFKAEELCVDCHSKTSNGDEFIPLQVSYHN